MDKYLQGFAVNLPSVNGTSIGGPTYFDHLKIDDKVLQFYMIFVSFFHVFFMVNN